VPALAPINNSFTHLLRFCRRVLSDFFLHNHGLLLTAAVAQNMMLSLIPLSAVLLVLFSAFLDPAMLLETISYEVALLSPGFAPTVAEVLTGFLDSRELIGWIGGITLLFFSSMAFRVIQDSIAIIFHRPVPTLKRRFWVSVMVPYLFVLIVVAGLIAITVLNAIINTQRQREYAILGMGLPEDGIMNFIVYLIGVCGLVLLFTLFYKIMPVARISFRRALAGGLTATVLWEGVRYLLVVYYTKFSAVNVIYGSMATIIVVLLTMEAIALILLLGAQVIADLQRSANAGIPWHEEPPEAPEKTFT
jgi:membrane protein